MKRVGFKGIVSLLMVACCVFTLFACKGKSDEPINKPQETATPSSTPMGTKGPRPEVTLPEDEFLPEETPVASATVTPTQAPIDHHSPAATTPAATEQPTAPATKTPTATPNKTATPTKKPTATPKPSGGIMLPPDYL